MAMKWCFFYSQKPALQQLWTRFVSFTRENGYVGNLFLVTFLREKVIANSELPQPFGKNILSEFDFGRGYVYLSQEFGELLSIKVLSLFYPCLIGL